MKIIVIFYLHSLCANGTALPVSAVYIQGKKAIDILPGFLKYIYNSVFFQDKLIK
jgi:hypothetical protein